MKPQLKPLVAAIIVCNTASADLPLITSHTPTTKQIKEAINDNSLILATGIFDPKNEQLNFQTQGIVAHPAKHYGIIQFDQGAVQPDWLTAHGFSIIQHLKNNAFVVNWQKTDHSLLTKNNNIRWFGPYQSGFKVSPNLWKTHRTVQSEYPIEIQTFKDYPVEKIPDLIKKLIPNALPIEHTIPRTDHRAAFKVSADDLDQVINVLAQSEAVQWINLYRYGRFFNEDAVPAIQDTSSNLNDQSIFDHGIYGTGQIVGVADSGLDRNEDWFVHHDNGSILTTAMTDAENTVPPQTGTIQPNNKVVAYWVMPGAAAYDHPSASYHGTHVTGSIAGDSANQNNGSVSSPTQSGYDPDDGMAPNAQILFQDIGNDNGVTGLLGSSSIWQQAYDGGARIHSNSYGFTTLGEYTSPDQNLDQTLRSLENMIILVAAGNDNGLNNSISSPGNSKNGLTVGALGHGNSSSVASYSNRGLTDDGRLKPDISATGTAITSASGDSNNSNSIDLNPSKKNLSGTSMSTPITAGATALLRQYFTDGFYPKGSKNLADHYQPSGSLMKALLLNGSNTDSGFNYRHTGWGRPWLDNTLYFNGDSRKIKYWDVTHQSGLSTGESATYYVDVLSGEEFRATLTWYDLPGPTGSGVTLVNDLNLTVVAPDGTYLGNQFDGAIQAVSQTGGSPDTINTVEQVRLTNPQSGTYEITVSAPDVPGDGEFSSDRQGYALVAGGALGSNAPLIIGDPTDLTVDNSDINGIDLSWVEANNADYYEIYRANGTCQNHEPGTMRLVGQATTTVFSDADTYGGYDFAYQIRAFNADDASNLSNCVDAISSQVCPIPPEFDTTSAQITQTVNDQCQISIGWNQGSSFCPNDPNVSYLIYRGTEHNFIPSNQNLVGTTNDSSFDDTTVLGGQPYFYRITAINNNNETPFSPELGGMATGTTSAQTGTITDNVDDSLLMATGGGTWSISNDRANSGLLSYRSTYEGATTYTSNTCARMYSPEISIPNTGNPSIEYQAWWQIEAQWDGVVVEISTDGGNNWQDLPPTGGYPSDFSLTQNPPINDCGYPSTQGAFGGASNGFEAIEHDLSSYAGETVLIRWSFSTDPGYEEEGMYIDDINYIDVYTANQCGVDSDLIFKDGFDEL